MDLQAKVSRRIFANEHYGILKACRRVGIDVDDYFRSRKIHCPFGPLFHSDGGDDPAMRVYEDDGHAYCFACQRRFSPSRLIADYEDISEDEAVETMLLELGVVKSQLGDRWEKAVAEEQGVDKQALAEAFRIAASYLITPWAERQYDPDVTRWMNKCLALLGKVETIEQGDAWLSTVKEVLAKKFRKEDQ